MRISIEEKEHLKKIKKLDEQIKNKSAKFILQIKEIFSTSFNEKNLHKIKKDKNVGVWINVVYYNKLNYPIHSYHQDSSNVIEAIHTLYAYSEPLFIYGKDDGSKYFYELFDNIKDRNDLFKITSVEFSLEFRKDYKIKN